MTSEEADVVVEAMTVLPHFPNAPAAQALIASELTAMCGTADQALWLARRMSQLYGKWPGMQEMRACYCSKFKPLDGIEQFSEVYSDGVPSEKDTRKALPPSPRAAITSSDSEAQELVRGLSVKHKR